eukprot:m.878864 g.878864  ORF g.878864 m.878864 type:complete len:374 (+) comp59839_c0_seq8:795-1916(+)
MPTNFVCVKLACLELVQWNQLAEALVIGGSKIRELVCCQHKPTSIPVLPVASKLIHLALLDNRWEHVRFRPTLDGKGPTGVARRLKRACFEGTNIWTADSAALLSIHHDCGVAIHILVEAKPACISFFAGFQSKFHSRNVPTFKKPRGIIEGNLLVLHKSHHSGSIRFANRIAAGAELRNEDDEISNLGGRLGVGGWGLRVEKQASPSSTRLRVGTVRPWSHKFVFVVDLVVVTLWKRDACSQCLNLHRSWCGMGSERQRTGRETACILRSGWLHQNSLCSPPGIELAVVMQKQEIVRAQAGGCECCAVQDRLPKSLQSLMLRGYVAFLGEIQRFELPDGCCRRDFSERDYVPRRKFSLGPRVRDRRNCNLDA